MYYGDHMSGWGWTFMVLGTVLFWAIVIAGIVLLVRRGRRGDSWGSNRPSPEELLAQRFARGEIDEAEFGNGWRSWPSVPRHRAAILRHRTTRASPPRTA